MELIFTIDHIRLTEPEKIIAIHETLVVNRRVVLVSFAVQRTHYPLLIAPDDAVLHIGFNKSYARDERGKGYYYTTLLRRINGGAYPLYLGALNASYVKEKLGLQTTACANNITAFLNALGADNVYTFLETIPLIKDSVDPTKVSKGSCFIHG